MHVRLSSSANPSDDATPDAKEPIRMSCIVDIVHLEYTTTLLTFPAPPPAN